jgi:hypothetical protein
MWKSAQKGKEAGHPKQEKLYCYNSTLIAPFHFSYDQLHK